MWFNNRQRILDLPAIYSVTSPEDTCYPQILTYRQLVEEFPRCLLAALGSPPLDDLDSAMPLVIALRLRPAEGAILSLVCLLVGIPFIHIRTKNEAPLDRVSKAVICAYRGDTDAHSGQEHHLFLDIYMTLINATLNVRNPWDLMDVAYIIRTSGTTSLNGRLVRVSRRSISTNIYSIRDRLFGCENISHRILGLLVSPLTFDPSIIEICLPLLLGCALIIPGRQIIQSPRNLFKLIKRFNIGLLMMTPTLWMRFTREQRHDLALSEDCCVHRLVLGGEPFPLKFVDEIRENRGYICRIWNIYGITECSVWGLLEEIIPCIVSSNYICGLITLGKPLHGTIIQIRCNSKLVLNEPEFKNYIGSGGELWMGGNDRICWVDEESDAELFTGDIVSITEGGNLRYICRKDMQIKRHGRLIDKDLITGKLMQLLQVTDCLVIFDKGSDIIFCVLVGTAKENIKKLKLFTNNQPQLIPYFEELDEFIFFPESYALPMTIHGKLDEKRIFEDMKENPQKSLSIDFICDTESNNVFDFAKSIFNAVTVHRNKNRMLPDDRKFFFLAEGGNSIDAIRIARKLAYITVAKKDHEKFAQRLLDVILHEPLSELLEILRHIPPQIQSYIPEGVITRVKSGNTSLLQFGWSFSMGKCVDAMPTVHNDIIYVGSHSGKFSAIGLNGNEVWSVYLPGRIECTAVVFRNVVIVGCNDWKLYFVSINSGKIIGSYRVDGEIKSAPTIHENSGTVWFSSYDCKIRALRILATEYFSVETMWEFAPQGNVLSPMAIDGNEMFATDSRGILYCLYAEKFDLSWNSKLCDKPIFSSPLIVGIQIIVVSVDGEFYIVDKCSGMLLWSVASGSPVFSTPTPFWTNSIIYGNYNRCLCILDLCSREIRVVAEFSANIKSSASVITVGSEQVIVVCSIDGRVKLLRSGFGMESLRPTATPKFKEIAGVDLPGEAFASPKTILQGTRLQISMGVDDAEPRVVQQLLEFTFRTTLDFLDSSSLFAEHAGRTEITVDDVKMAIQTKIDVEFTGPPPRELLAEIADERNSEPLPLISEKYGVRLPLERYCLIQPNYQVIGSSADKNDNLELPCTSQEQLQQTPPLL